ncbi:MAG: biliverdin-producing heme oxygenase, partial [Pseudoxanthomonas sp.]
MTADPLSQRLKTETEAQHLRMHALMERAQPFASRAHYARFVAIQYLFQRDVEHLFDDPQVRAVVSDLDARGRVEAARADLRDLQAPLPEAGAPAS